MNPRFKILEILYFFGAAVLLITGICFKSAAAVGMGLYLLYSGRKRVLTAFMKVNLIWDLIFLAISVLMLFSVVKVILNIVLCQEIFNVSQWLIPVAGLGFIYFELLFRISGEKKNRFAVFLLMVLLISSTGSFILGGHWLKADIFLGFLSLTFTVIISFRRAYLELSDLLS